VTVRKKKTKKKKNLLGGGRERELTCKPSWEDCVDGAPIQKASAAMDKEDQRLRLGGRKGIRGQSERKEGREMVMRKG